VDRAVLVTGTIIAALLIALVALSSLLEYANPVFVNGSDTASRIDDVLGNMIAARYPDIAVGPARCPLLLNLTGKRTARCTLPVGENDMRVEVEKPYVRGFVPVFRNLDGIFVRRDAERTIAAQLADRYGETFDVRCPGPAVRVVDEAMPVTCSIAASDVLRRGIEVHVSGQDGDVRAEELASIPSRAERVFGREIAERKEGSIAIPGRAMESYVRGSASADARGEVGRRGLAGTAHCPPRIALHEGGLTTCTVRVGGVSLTYDVHFEKGPGLYVQAQKRIEVVALLREIATRYYERPTYTGGKPLAARVDCGAGRVAFVEPGSSVPCTVRISNETRSFAFEIDDPEGHFTIVED
jgi:hypothetical protein